MGFESYLIEFLIERTMNEVKQNSFERDAKPVAGSLHSADMVDSLGRVGNARLDSALNLSYKRRSRSAQVAQLVEQRTENPCVGGSIPPLGTTVVFRSPAIVRSASCRWRRRPDLAVAAGCVTRDSGVGA